MYPKLKETISCILKSEVNQGRRITLQPLIDYIQHKRNLNQDIHINFICTHNSRRSHLSQVWAQVAAAYYTITNVYCYSGGTEETALFPTIADTLNNAGFEVHTISGGSNPVYAFKYMENVPPIISFSKRHDDTYNPQSAFAAVMTCSQADIGCPFIVGAEIRIPITYADPKVSDGTNQQTKTYKKRSLEIASEMFYVFSQIK